MNGFINPYTFLPVSEGSKKPFDEYFSPELISGKIECTLKTRTQIAVCDPIAELDSDFFKVDGKAVIPGSSIRGTLRNVFEALTDSCFSSTNADDDDFFTSRLNKRKNGLIEKKNGEYILYEGVRYKDNRNEFLADYKTGDEVTFNSYSKNGRSGTIHYFKDVNKPGALKHGYVHKVDRFRVNKDTYSKDSVIEKLGGGVTISKKSIELLEINILKYDTKNKSISEDYKNQFYKMTKGEGVLPIWYYEENGNYYLAPSQMSRAVFFNRPADMLKKAGLYKCDDRKSVCSACALFGTVSEKGDKLTKVSRLRFSDAVCEDKNCFDKKYLLPVLSSPRLSSFEFYLNSKKDEYTADSNGTIIAGRKFYWHNNYAKITHDAKLQAENMQCRAELVKAESTFGFTVYFERITDDQLKKLLFTINLGENRPDSDRCHKVGHGKPIGLGSAKIVVDKVTVREFANGVYSEKALEEYPDGDFSDLFENQENVRNILKVTNFNAVNGRDISYPKTSVSEDIFKWFAENRGGLKSIGKPMRYYHKLPRLTDEDQHLPFDPKPNKNGGRQGNNSFDRNKMSNSSFGFSTAGSIRFKNKRK